MGYYAVIGAKMILLVWSKATPTNPGWYWRRFGTNVSIDEICDVDGVLYVQVNGRLRREDLLVGEWAGPIEPPGEQT